ncbi:MAG: hypothetical protein LBQ91_01225 [Oscillospiraceae bacterium]|nr:hypothetical protein [Oscillospiraceae bacterium]
MATRKKTGKTGMFGRITAITLSLAFLLAAVPAASAADGMHTWYPPRLALAAEAASAANLGNKGRVVKGNDVYSQKSYSRQTAYKGIRSSTDGYYAMEVDVSSGTDTVPVGRLDIDLCDTAAVNAALLRSDISDNVKAAIYEKHLKALENGDESVTASLFSSDLLYSGSSNAAQLPTGSASFTVDSLLAVKGSAITAAPLSTTTITYYTYNGSQMKSEKLYTNGISTGWEYIQRGATSGTTAGNIFSVIVNAVGVTTTAPIPFVSAAISLLQTALNQLSASSITGHGNDYVQARVMYNDVQQWTYLNAGGSTWWIGLYSQQVTVTRVSSEQYYYNAVAGGRIASTDRTNLNIVKKTAHFDSPWAYAYQWANNYVTETVQCKIGSKTLYF